MTTLEPTGALEPAAPLPELGSSPLALQYDRLRVELGHLWSAPVRDMLAIDAVLAKLDETHAAFKAEHGVRDHQCF